MKSRLKLIVSLSVVCIVSSTQADDLRTSLTDASVRYRVADEHYVRMSRDDLSIIVVDNEALDLPDLPRHRAGYNGVASLTHTQHPQNLFVPGIAGLNFEHIHDGTTSGLVEKFEPRRFPMELRVIDDITVEVYQPPTGNFQLESCGRYQLLEGGVIEYTFQCIPRADRFTRRFAGLFWASYIHQPGDKSIWFFGRPAGSRGDGRLINGVTPRHGVASTHRPMGTLELPPVDDDFPLTLVNHPSDYEYTQPWYYGISHGLALVQMFRAEDNIWMAQSPSGGGNGNPAWDFQWFIHDPVVGQTYGFVMRTACLPFENVGQLKATVAKIAP